MVSDQKLIWFFLALNLVFIIYSAAVNLFLKNKHYQSLIENEVNLLIVIKSKQLVIDAYKQLEQQRKENEKA